LQLLETISTSVAAHPMNWLANIKQQRINAHLVYPCLTKNLSHVSPKYPAQEGNPIGFFSSSWTPGMFWSSNCCLRSYTKNRKVQGRRHKTYQRELKHTHTTANL
jgi:hypothetical protein